MLTKQLKTIRCKKKKNLFQFRTTSLRIFIFLLFPGFWFVSHSPQQGQISQLLYSFNYLKQFVCLFQTIHIRILPYGLFLGRRSIGMILWVSLYWKQKAFRWYPKVVGTKYLTGHRPCKTVWFYMCDSLAFFLDINRDVMSNHIDALHVYKY